jgi:hypothetical protein
MKNMITESLEQSVENQFCRMHKMAKTILHICHTNCVIHCGQRASTAVSVRRL